MEEYEGELTNSIGNMILAILRLHFFFAFFSRMSLSGVDQILFISRKLER